MNLWRQKIIDNYLYEIIDDYHHADSDSEKEDLYKLLCSSIWSCKNKRQIYTKTIRFTVRKDSLKSDIGQIFNNWSHIEYTGYKSISKDTDWCSLIRQKINNLYTRYFDKDVILKKDYISLLSTPKRLYYQWIDGMEMQPDQLTALLKNTMDLAKKQKILSAKQKMELSWNEFKKVIEGFLRKILNNCKLIEDYEDQTACTQIYDFMNEDNLYI